MAMYVHLKWLKITYDLTKVLLQAKVQHNELLHHHVKDTSQARHMCDLPCMCHCHTQLSLAKDGVGSESELLEGALSYCGFCSPGICICTEALGGIVCSWESFPSFGVVS